MFLIINTIESGKIVLVLGQADKVVAKQETEAMSDKLLNQLELFLSKQKIGLADIDKIIVINGPGSFTSVRIAVLLANNLSEFKGIALSQLKYKPDLSYENILAQADSLPVLKQAQPFYGQEPNITVKKD